MLNLLINQGEAGIKGRNKPGNITPEVHPVEQHPEVHPVEQHPEVHPVAYTTRVAWGRCMYHPCSMGTVYVPPGYGRMGHTPPGYKGGLMPVTPGYKGGLIPVTPG